MNEKEKMLAGQIYDANYDKELFEKRILAKDLCQKFNNCEFTKLEEKKKILENLIQKEINIKVTPNPQTLSLQSIFSKSIFFLLY